MTSPGLHMIKNLNPKVYYSTYIFSTVETCKNCAKCGKYVKIGTDEADNIKIKSNVGSILKIFCFC